MTGGLEPEDETPAAAPRPRAPRRATTPPPESGVDGRVLAVLVAEPRPWTAEEIAARTDVPLRTVKRALGKLVHDRHLRKAGGGKFTLSRRR